MSSGPLSSMFSSVANPNARDPHILTPLLSLFPSRHEDDNHGCSPASSSSLPSSPSELLPPPPPYVDEELLSPSQLGYNVAETEISAAPEDENLPEYSVYDEQRGSLIDRLLGQYARSISPPSDVEHNSCSLVGSSESGSGSGSDDESFRFPDLSMKFLKRNSCRSAMYCLALCLGVVVFLAWVLAVGYALAVALRDIWDYLA